MSSGTVTKLTNATVATGTTVSQPTLDLMAAMGHGNGSGATEEFTNLPHLTQTFIASNFGDAGDADEVKITAAIAYVAGIGGGAVVIPRSMFGYDATSVTYDPTVKMLAEGCSWAWHEVTPEAFGAAINGTTDSYNALQAMWTWMASQTGTYGNTHVVRLGSMRYQTSKPLWIKTETFLKGDGTGYNGSSSPSSKIRATYYGGPIFVAESSSSTVTGLTAALVTGTGQGWTGNRYTRVLTLRDASQSLDLDGVAAFTVEFFYKPAAAAATGNLCASSGRFLSNDTNTQAFLFTANTVKVTLSGSGALTLTGGTIADTNVHHLAVSYDGTTVRYFQDGSLVSSTAGSGTWSQQPAEDVTVGGAIDKAPIRGFTGLAANGVFDSFRISNSARYTAAFTAPTAKFAQDANTLCLLNFDEQIGSFTKMRVGASSTAWAWELDTATTTAVYFNLENVTLDANGGCTGLWPAPYGQFDWRGTGVYLLNVRNGIFALGQNAYDNAAQRIFIEGYGTARYGVVYSNTAGLGTLGNVWTTNFLVHGVFMGSGMAITQWHLQENASAYAGVLVAPLAQGAAMSFNELSFDTEVSPDTSLFRASILYDGQTDGGATFQNTTIAAPSSGALPFVVADSPRSLRFDNCQFNLNGSSPTEIMQFQGTYRHPVIFDNCRIKDGSTETFVRWSDTAGAAAVSILGRTSATPSAGAVTLDFSRASNYSIDQLAANLTAQTWQYAGDGQPIVVRYRQASSGGPYTAADPGNVIGWASIDSTAGNYSLWEGYYDQGLAKFVGKMTTGLT